MILTVNGEQREAPEGATLSSLLDSLGLRDAALVIEHNGEIVGRDHAERTRLREGDRLELVRFVGGG